MKRVFFLRGYGARSPFVDSIPSPADDCSKCRGGKWPCETPLLCDPPPKVTWFNKLLARLKRVGL